MDFKVTRAHLKRAVEQQDWDLLDKLLEMDNSGVNDNNLFTDTWGSWFGPLYWCVGRDEVPGVQVLLKHGADPELKCWGDCDPMSPLEMAREGKKFELLPLLTRAEPACYERTAEPELPREDARDRAVNRQGTVAETTGLVFPVEAFPED